MLSILLINNNKIVSRLLQLSSQKHNYSLEESEEYTPQKESYNVVFVDSDLYDPAKVLDLSKKVRYDKLGYLGERGSEKPEMFELVLEKPFLPTDFVNLMDDHFKFVDPADVADEITDDSSLESLNEDEFDLDSLEEITEDDELDLDLLGSEVETTGEINDIANEIEEIDGLDKIDKDSDLSSLDESIESTVSEEVAIAGEDKFDSELESIVDEDMVKASLQEVMESESISDESKIDTVALGAAAMASAVASTAFGSSNDEMEKESTTDEFEALDEKSVKEALFDQEKEVSTNTEEIEIKEENLGGEVEAVDPRGLEDVIAKALSKALTKEMIQEALKDMEIVVSLKGKES